MAINNPTPTEHLATLRKRIIARFDLEDLRILIFDLGVNYDDLRGETISAKIQALLEYLEKRNRVHELQTILKKRRPKEEWDSYLPSKSKSRSPYKGLQFFTETDAPLFFGREQLTAELVDHLSKHHFLAIVGASGSGKSSVVRAGVITALRDGLIATNGRSSADWPIHIITPGDSPLKALAATFTHENESVTATKTLWADLKAGGESLDLYLYRQMSHRQDGRFLLIIDQFEELFTQCNDPKERTLFVENLVMAVTSNHGRLSLIIALRADFYDSAVKFESLRLMLETRQKIVGAMNRTELRQAIEGPAKKTGWELQSGLVRTMLQDVGQEPGALALLSHALQETWLRREGSVMTLAGYQSAGGVQQAIAHTADAVYESLSPDQKEVSWKIFSRLIDVDKSSLETRRRAKFTELVPTQGQVDIIQEVIDILVRNRLIITDDTNIELTHEALIENWPKLKQWLEQNKNGLIIRNRLSAFASEWKENGKQEDFLITGKQLEIFEKWSISDQMDINYVEREFLEISRKKIQQEKRAKSYVIGFLSVLTLFTLFTLFLFRLPPFTPTWVWTNGPVGGDTWAPAVNPNVPNDIFIGYAKKGVYKSQDGGYSWFPANTGLATALANLLYDSETNTIFAIADGQALYQSKDGGSNWVSIDEGLPSDIIIRDMSLYNGLSKELFIATWQYGIWSTPIDEIRWQQKTWQGLKSPSIHQIKISQGSPPIMYASSSHQGIFRSIDLGTNWEQIAFSEGDITQIGVAPWNKEIIYVYDAISGPYISQDGGLTWLSIADQVTERPRSWPYFYTNAQTNAIFIGTYNGQVFRSDDNGNKWESVWANIPLATIRHVRILPPENDVLLSTSNGVYLSNDGGISWLLTGPEELPVSTIISSSNDSEAGILVATNSGIYHKHVGGTWETLNGGLGELKIRKMVASTATSSSEIYAISDRNLYVLGKDKNMWQPITLPEETKVVLLASESNGPPSILIVNEENQIYHTSDMSNWRYLWQAPSIVTAILESLQLPETFYLTTSNNGVYHSTDAGATWLPINNGLTNPSVNDLVASNNNGDLLYAATENGVFVSLNRGQFWNHSTTGLTIRNVTSIAIHPVYDAMVYAGTPGGAFVSYDYGKTWRAYDKGLQTKQISSISVDDQFVYVGTNRGVYYMKHPVIPTLQRK